MFAQKPGSNLSRLTNDSEPSFNARAGPNQVVIGHKTKAGWTNDATKTVSQTISPNTNYDLAATFKGTTVSVLLNPSTLANGQQVAAASLGYVFNAVVTDGQAGLFTRGGGSAFTKYTVKSDDPKFLTQTGFEATPVLAASTATVSAMSVTVEASAQSDLASSLEVTSLYSDAGELIDTPIAAIADAAVTVTRAASSGGTQSDGGRSSRDNR